MPVYRYRDPETGQTVRLRGDSPPTEKELEDIFAQLGSPEESAAPAAPKPEAEPSTAGRVAGFGARVLGPFIGGALAAPIPIPGARIAGAVAGGAVAEYLASYFEGDEEGPSAGRVLASAALAPIPGAKVTGGFGKVLAARAAQGALEGAAQESIESVVDEGELNLRRAALGATGGAVLGGAFGGIEAKLMGKEAARQIVKAQEAPRPRGRVKVAPVRKEFEDDAELLARKYGEILGEVSPPEEAAITAAAAPRPAAPGRGPFRKIGPLPEDTPPVQPKTARVVSSENVDEFAHLDDAGKARLGEILDEEQDALQKAAQGRISIERQAKEAERVAIDVDDIPKGEVAGTGSQLFATKNFAEAMTAKIKRLEEQLADPDSGVDPARLEAAIERSHYNLVEGIGLMQNITSTAGRTLRSAREATRGATPLEFKPKFTKTALKAGASADEIVAALQRAGDDPTKLFRELLLIQKQRQSKTDAALGWYISNLLFHPKTFARNGFGNMVRLASDIATKPLAAGIDVAVSAATGRERQVFANESVALAAGVLKSIPEATRAFMQVWRQGFTNRSAIRMLAQGRFENLPISPALGTKGERVFGLTSRILEGTDAFFRLLSESAHINAAAMRRAEKLGAELAREGAGVSKKAIRAQQQEFYTKWLNALDQAEDFEFADEIEELASRSLFREKSQFARRLNDTIADLPPAARVVARMFIPFIRTPTNIVKQGFTWAGGGFFAGAKRGGVVVQRQKQAEAALGTMIMGSLVALAADGRITGPAPRGERDEFLTQYPENSIYLGDDLGWVRYTDLGPVAIPLSVASAFVEKMAEAKRQPEELTDEEVAAPFFQATQAAIDAGFDSILNFPFMQGIEEIMDLVSGHGDAGDRLVNLGRRRLSGIFGGPGRLAKEALDVKRRQVTSKTGGALAVEVPGLSKEERPRLSFFGREVERPSMVSPFDVSQPDKREAAVARELSRLRIPITTDRPVTSLTQNKKTVKLSPGEDVALRKAKGAVLLDELEKLFASPRYQKATPTKQREMAAKKKRDVRAMIQNRAFSRKRAGLTFTDESLRTRRF